MDTSLTRKRTPPGPYRRPMPGVLGGWAFSYGRGSPVVVNSIVNGRGKYEVVNSVVVLLNFPADLRGVDPGDKVLHVSRYVERRLRHHVRACNTPSGTERSEGCLSFCGGRGLGGGGRGGGSRGSIRYLALSSQDQFFRHRQAHRPRKASCPVESGGAYRRGCGPARRT